MMPEVPVEMLATAVVTPEVTMAVTPEAMVAATEAAGMETACWGEGS